MQKQRKWFRWTGSNLQKKVLYFSVINFLVSIGFCFLLVKLFIGRIEALSAQYNFPIDHPFFAFLKIQSGFLFQSFLGFLIVLFIAQVFLMFLFSEHLEGPYRRLLNLLDQKIHSGAASEQKFALRKGDFLYELGEKLNQAFTKKEDSQ